MLKHSESLFSQVKSEVCDDGSVCTAEGSDEDLVFKHLRHKFSLFIILSVQISSKLILHTNVSV